MLVMYLQDYNTDVYKIIVDHIVLNKMYVAWMMLSFNYLTLRTNVDYNISIWPNGI